MFCDPQSEKQVPEPKPEHEHPEGPKDRPPLTPPGEEEKEPPTFPG